MAQHEEFNLNPGRILNVEATFGTRPVGPSVSSLEHEMAPVIDTFNETLASIFPVARYTIDEIAVMFPDEDARMAWLMSAVKEEGVTIFNAATDVVKTNPIRSTYVADYVFLNRSGLRWRIEAMVVQEGVSPLHAPMADEIRPVHASFKVHSRREWAKVYDAIAEDEDFWLAQSCVSDYGRFAYFAHCGEEETGLYLKPRVNTRDA